jgi:hypothetical protein
VGTKKSLPCRHKKGTGGVAYSPDGARVATGCQDGVVRLWDPDDGKLLAELGPAPVTQRRVCFSRDGAWLLSADQTPDNQSSWIRVWDVAKKSEAFSFRAHDGAVLTMSLSHDGTRLLTTGADLKAKVWKMSDFIPAGK